jgi:hypothetical protein
VQVLIMLGVAVVELIRLPELLVVEHSAAAVMAP